LSSEIELNSGAPNPDLYSEHLPLIGGTFRLSSRRNICLVVSFGIYLFVFHTEKNLLWTKKLLSPRFLVLSVPLAWKYRPATGYVVGVGGGSVGVTGP
jgi:hypothetical protein